LLPCSITTCKRPVSTALIVCVPSVLRTWSSHQLIGSILSIARPIARHVPNINHITCCLAVNLSCLLRSFLWKVFPVRPRTGMPLRPLSRTTLSPTENHYRCWWVASPLAKVGLSIHLDLELYDRPPRQWMRKSAR
jgi:hypothetical protein